MLSGMNGMAVWIRTIGTRTRWAAPALLLFVGGAGQLGWLQGPALYVALLVVLALVMTTPLAAIWAGVPGESFVERRARHVKQSRERSMLAAAGLTPEQYIATIPATDVFRRAEAAERFGVALAPERAGPV